MKKALELLLCATMMVGLLAGAAATPRRAAAVTAIPLLPR